MTERAIPMRLANEYVRCVDQRVFSELDSILWPEFTQQGPGFAAASREEFIANLDVLLRYEQTFHMLGSVFGRWQGDCYRGESYCMASHLHREPDGLYKLDMAIRYQDVIELRDGQAKYCSRDLLLVWSEDRLLSR